MPATETAAGSGVKITAPQRDEFAEILTPQALALVAKLHRAFDGRRKELLARRAEVQARLDGGWLPDFLEDTRSIREGDWRVAPIPQDLLDRRVEITGPVDRKMVINALNSGAKVFMADFEDAHSPTWNATLEGQINVRDAIRGVIDYESPEGKKYDLHKHTATLMVRPRGWHLSERHVTVDGQPVSGSLFDFSLYFYHNAQALLDRGTGPYFYLPKLENHQEARLWNDVFVMAQRELGLPVGTIKATVLIETILAAFEMDEILYELRDHIAGLNCGRWDYIFSFIKKFRNRPDFVLPDRALVTMTTHFLRSYSQLTIKTCHRRGAFAMGGMAAQIPIKTDAEANANRRSEGTRRQGSRGRRRPRRHLGRPSRAGADRHGGLQRTDARTQPARPAARRRPCHRGRSACRSQRPDHRGGPAHQHQRRAPLPRELAARLRLRAHLQPDGRRCHLRDLAHSDLAMDPASPWRARRRPQDHRRAVPQLHGRGTGQDSSGHRPRSV